MRNIFTTTTLFAFILFCSSAFAQETLFQRSLGGSGTENSYGLQRALDGGLISVGYTTSFGTGKKDVLLTKFDGLGKIEWSKAYGGSGDETGWSVSATNDSGYLVTGTTNSFNSSNDDALIFKTDKDGKIEWTRSISSDSIEDAYYGIKSFFNGYYVVGYVKNDTAENDAFVARLGSGGDIRWYREFGSIGDEEAYGVAEDKNGNVIICGMTSYDSLTQGGLTKSNTDAFIAKFDSTGVFGWFKTIGSTTDDVAWNIVSDNNENQYALVGWTEALNRGHDDMLFVLTDTAGKLKSQTVFGSVGGHDRAFGITVKAGRGNGYAVVGYGEPNIGNRDIVLTQFDKNGASGAFNIIGSTGRDGHWPTSITTTRDEGLAFLSTTNSFNSSNGDDLYLVKTSKDGDANCNSTIGQVDFFNIGFSSSTSNWVTFGHKDSKPTLTTTTVTTLKDTTLCCKLSAELLSDTIKTCTGFSVNIGRLGTTGATYTWTDGAGKVVSNEANPRISPSKTDTYKLVVSSSDSKCSSDSATVVVIVNTALNEDFATDTSMCTGDSVTVIGSKNLISYTWTGTNVQAFTRSFKVKQADTIHFYGIDANSCAYRDTMIVTEHSLPVFSLGADTTICAIDGITLSGPAGATSYKWDNGDTTQNRHVSTPNTYSLEVKNANGCVFSDDIRILTNPSSSFDLGADDTFCMGTTYTILGPGALTGYIWNGVPSTDQNLDVTQAGTYDLTAFNSFGCPSRDTIVLETRNQPVFDLGDSIGLCLGSSKYISGPKGLTAYKWWNGTTADSVRITNSGDDFWLEVTDEFTCTWRDSFNVFNAKNPVISLADDTTICIGDSLLLTPGPDFAKYVWSTTATTASIYVKEKGTYSVTVTDDNGCSGNASMNLDTMTCVNGIEDLLLAELKLFPVPASENINLTFEAATPDQMSIKLVDLSGRVLQTIETEVFVGVNRITIPVNEVAAGSYFVWLNNSNGSASLKILIE
jgi:hypothetical protein